MPVSAHTAVAPEASGWSTFPSTHQPRIYRAFEPEHPVLTSSPLPAFLSLAIRFLCPGFLASPFSICGQTKFGLLSDVKPRKSSVEVPLNAIICGFKIIGLFCVHTLLSTVRTKADAVSFFLFFCLQGHTSRTEPWTTTLSGAGSRGGRRERRCDWKRKGNVACPPPFL